jgi:hypothetical protein
MAAIQGSWFGVVGDAEQGLVGSIGRITVSIPAGGPGEVLLSVRGGTEAFAALSDEPIRRHSRVVVIECISARSVVVMRLP